MVPYCLCPKPMQWTAPRCAPCLNQLVEACSLTVAILRMRQARPGWQCSQIFAPVTSGMWLVPRCAAVSPYRGTLALFYAAVSPGSSAMMNILHAGDRGGPISAGYAASWIGAFLFVHLCYLAEYRSWPLCCCEFLLGCCRRRQASLRPASMFSSVWAILECWHGV